MKQKYIRIGLIAVTAVLVLGSAGFIGVKHQSYSKTMKQKEAQLAALKGDYEEAKKNAETSVLTEEAADKLVNSAKTAGEAVAKLENTYMSIFGQNLSEEKKTAELGEISKQMDTYFGENTPLRTAWYTWDTTRLYNANWSFRSNFNFEGQTMRVIWECNSADALLAYVIADYDAETNTFSNYAKHITKVGNAYVPYTGEEQEGIDMNPDTVLGLMDDLGLSEEFQQKYDEMTSDEEYQKEREENAKAREFLKEQQKGDR